MRTTALLVALMASVAHAADELEVPALGFRLAVPDGWRLEERAVSPTHVHVALHPDGLPAGELGAARADLRVNTPGTAGRTRREARALAVEAAEADGRYVDVVLSEPRVLGQEAARLEARYTGASLPIRFRQDYLRRHDVVFVLQVFAPEASWEAWSARFAALWTGLRWTELSPEALARRRLLELAGRCGSEVDWADRWVEAATRARAEARPVLVTARFYSAFALTDERMAGPFMNRDILALIETRYVPFRLERPGDVPFADRERYGLGPHTFGTAALIVTPDGDVLAEAQHLTERFLRDGLRLDPSLPGPPPDGGPTRTARAREHLRRGELEEAGRELSGAATAEALRLRASLHRRRRHGEAALDDLAAARQAPGAERLRTALDLDEAVVLLRLGRFEEARARLHRVTDEDPASGEARYWLGALADAEGDREEARALWTAVSTERPDDRWAWLSAARLTSTAFTLGEPRRLSWPPEEDWAGLAPVPPSPVGIDQAAEAAEDAVAFLLAAQRPDGSWWVPSRFGAEPDEAPDDFQLAAAALAVRALLPHRERAEVAEAVSAGVRWMIDGHARARREARPVWFMDYGVWSRWAMLAAASDLVTTGWIGREELAPLVETLVRELAERQKPGGGWSYYVTSDASAGGEASPVAFSFVTAAVILALVSARDAGFEVPPELVDRGVEELLRARSDEMRFAYRIGAATVGPPASTAGRDPVCTRALVAVGRAGEAALSAAVDRFVTERDALAREAGKVLMHTGPEGQGSHYVLFDLCQASEAAATLPPARRAAVRTPLLTMLLELRTADGAFQDNPILGRVPGGALGLIALDRLLHQP